MNADTLTVLFRHHLWANLCLLEHCANLTAEQLEARIAGSYGSIHETLEHIARSEQSYFSRISTGQPYAHPEDAPRMSMQEMAAALRQTGEGLIEWAPKVQAEDAVEVNWRGVPRQVPKSIILTQVINHATEHREQIKAIITELGIEPPDLQSWVYFGEIGR
ncbi:MAG: DinB family protein [Anaerolineales bacterium]|nr:DinB family protein [Anaerolineales bacterium]